MGRKRNVVAKIYPLSKGVVPYELSLGFQAMLPDYLNLVSKTAGLLPELQLILKLDSVR